MKKKGYTTQRRGEPGAAHGERGEPVALLVVLVDAAPDLPALTVDHLESPSPFTALGAKGLGEGATMSAPVAIANAVADALGVDDLELPLTAPRVWELIHRSEGAAG